MAVPEAFAGSVGDWSGTNVLHVPWMPEPIKRSDSRAVLSEICSGQFIRLEYTWTYEGKPQQGLLIFGSDPKSASAQAVWTDSWHSANVLMLCDGSVKGSTLTVEGKYAVPDNPDWGWRTELTPGTDSLLYRMYNVTPEGFAELAVETDFLRS